MTPTDALFWTMDRIPELRSTIGALVILEKAPSRRRLSATFGRLSQELVRLRQRVVEVPLALSTPEWADDSQFDLDYHVRSLAVPNPGGMEDLLAELSPLFATALDRERPLWEAYVARGLAGKKGAVFIKMHHCLMDGVGGSRLFAGLLKRRDEPDRVKRSRANPDRDMSASAIVGRALWDNFNDAWQAAAGGLGSLSTSGFGLGDGVSGGWKALRMVTGFGRELTLRRAASPLDQARSLSRRLATFQMSLKDLDRVRRPLRATHNDIVLAVVSGAMRRWHMSRGAYVRELRALVPVNLRADTEAGAGNRLALLAVDLPVGERDPVRRLRLIQERMGRVKTDRRADMYPLLARAMTAMPLTLAERLSRRQTVRANFVCTNVPGPTHKCFMAGEKIEAVYPYAPLVGDHPVAIALYSYGGVLYVGLDVDPLAMDDLPNFREALAESYAEVLATHGRKPPARARRNNGGTSSAAQQPLGSSGQGLAARRR
jgi:WS/DGAT/MGAT family acyltransferase